MRSPLDKLLNSIYLKFFEEEGYGQNDFKLSSFGVMGNRRSSVSLGCGQEKKKTNIHPIQIIFLNKTKFYSFEKVLASENMLRLLALKVYNFCFDLKA